MRHILVLLFLIIVIGFVPGCKTGSKTVSNESLIKTEIREKLIPVVNPADSANIRALLECDENGRILLSWYDSECSENAKLRFQIDSIGHLLANFSVPTDTIYIKGKDSISVVDKIVTKEVERKFNKWEKICLWFTPIMIIIIGFIFAYKIKRIIKI